MDMAETIKLVTFGRGGDTAYCSDDKWGKCTISGYGRPDRPHAGESTDARPIADGTPALDLLPAIETDEGFKWAFKGPMVDVDLAEEVERCPDASPMFAAAVSGNQFGTMLAVHAVTKGSRAGALDSVSIGEYVREWVNRGARLGHYRNGKIEW
jgi:hypothetical protein